jgi:hypothetical protein
VLLIVLLLVGLGCNELALDPHFFPVVSIANTNILELFKQILLAHFLFFVVMA